MLRREVPLRPRHRVIVHETTKQQDEALIAALRIRPEDVSLVRIVEIPSAKPAKWVDPTRCHRKTPRKILSVPTNMSLESRGRLSLRKNQ